MPLGSGKSSSFKAIRAKIIASLEAHDYEHEIREVGARNLLATGAIADGEVIELLARCLGTQYHTDHHHRDQSVLVHIFKPKKKAVTWYIKAYFRGGDLPDDEITVFISVHKSEGEQA